MKQDIKTISHLLPYCDAMFIDKECHALLREQPLAKEINYSTKIFSLNNKDEFLEYLDNIENETTAEHMKAVEDIYGDAWKKPYTSIFE